VKVPVDGVYLNIVPLPYSLCEALNGAPPKLVKPQRLPWLSNTRGPGVAPSGPLNWCTMLRAPAAVNSYMNPQPLELAPQSTPPHAFVPQRLPALSRTTPLKLAGVLLLKVASVLNPPVGEYFQMFPPAVP